MIANLVGHLQHGHKAGIHSDDIHLAISDAPLHIGDRLLQFLVVQTVL